MKNIIFDQSLLLPWTSSVFEFSDKKKKSMLEQNFCQLCSVLLEVQTTKKAWRNLKVSYLSSLRHWKWMDDSNKSTPVLSGSCLQSCMQCLSAASKSPAWYSRWANSANPWKESIRFVGSGESPKHLRGENKKLDNGNKTKKKTKTKQWEKNCTQLKD